MAERFKIGNSLHWHEYPRLVVRWPRLVRWLHGWNNLVLQRNWLVNSTLRRLLPTLPTGSLVVDAGCGDGQHVFRFCKKHPRLRFLGIDKNEGNVAFCERYVATVHRPPSTVCHFFHQNLEDLTHENEAGLLLCVGTLQYIEDDRRVLRNFHKALKTNGLLLLYVPVNGRMVLPPYRHFFKKLNHYEKSQQRQRVYTPEEILQKTTGAGFEVREQRFNYGVLGIVGHEVYSLLLMGLGNAALWWSWVFVPLMVALLPMVLIFKGLDFILPKKNGNGLLLLAEKIS
ncbi:MAG: class I SAM-dependent methyltransferase [Bacteroidetes bacterium]|nr:class I SAM-dependent methyltransferase [Bacteroidota bacterium]